MARKSFYSNRVSIVLAICIYSICLGNLKGQGMHDAVWLLGLDNSPGVTGGGTVIDFTEYPPKVFYELRAEDFYIANTSLSDSKGNLLFYSNGCSIFNKNRDYMVNGDTLSPGYLAATWCDDESAGSPVQQSVLALNFPGNDTSYLLLNDSCKLIILDGVADTRSFALLMNKVVFPQGDTLGEVSIKGKALIRDTLTGGYLQAIRHANGRDWWVITPEYFSNCYYVAHVSTDGLIELKKQCLGEIFGPVDGSSQTTTSTNGNIYARVSPVSGLQILEFDRCMGEFYNPRWLDISEPDISRTGISISPSSQFLYVSGHHMLYQFDLLSNNLEASKTLIGVWDGGIPNFPTKFYLSQLAPNGKIYIGSNGTHLDLHVIHSPDLPGINCNFEQRALHLYSPNSWGMPSFPNYRLGPIDGSVCDTLGINNNPIANFRWEVKDSLAPLDVTFIDLSSYEPDEWNWSFGDNINSQDTNPIHAFSSPGIYTVCQIVSNSFNSDTICHEVKVGTVSSKDQLVQSLSIRVWPNPAKNELTISLSEPGTRLNFTIYDVLGNELMSKRIQGHKDFMNLQGLAQGIYLWRCQNGKRLIQFGKLVKVD